MQHSALKLSCLLMLAPLAAAQTFGPGFTGSYAIRDLGAPANVPVPFGGVTFLAGDSNTLLLAGSADSFGGAIYRVPVQRDASGHIASFGGSTSLHSTAPYIDGGLSYGPGGVLCYVSYPVNTFGQIRPGSVTPDKIVDLASIGIATSPGGLVFVPSGFAGAGRMKIISWGSAQWFDVDLLPDANGTFDLAPATLVAQTAGGGPEGAVYIPAGNPGFNVDSVLVPEFSAGRVSAYAIDANGNPLAATQRDFITGLSGAEGALVDPLTGDFVFSTFGGVNRVLVVTGFNVPTVYCQAKPSSNGCTPAIGFSGTPSLGGLDDFVVLGNNVTNQRNAIMLWGLSAASAPFAGGTLCISAPLRRGPIESSGGNPSPALDCSGSLSFAISHAFMGAHGLSAGTAVYSQILVRDPAFADPNTLALSQGLRFTIEN